MIVQKGSILGKRYGKKGQLEVVACAGKDSSKNTLWDVKCHECSKDPEMYGDAVYTMLRSNINKDVVPCGCSAHCKWSREQYQIRVERHCALKGYEFVRFGPVWNGNCTKLVVYCSKHNVEFYPTISALLDIHKSCPDCVQESRFGSDEPHISSFKSTGKFPEGTKFWRDFTKAKSASSWFIECPVCSHDKFVKAGLCDGVFKSSTYSLSLGLKPCRCSVILPLTQEQQEFEIRERLTAANLTFLRWDTAYLTTPKTFFTFNCPEHGDKTISVYSFVHNKHICRECGGSGFDVNREGTLYVLKIAGRASAFTGYGITCDPVKRLRDHARNLSEYGYRVEESKIFHADGFACRDTENSLLKSFPIIGQEVEGFRTEATHAHLYDEVVAFVQSKLASLSHSSNESSCA